MSNRIEALATLERAVQSFFSLQRFAAVLNGMRSALGRRAPQGAVAGERTSWVRTVRAAPSKGYPEYLAYAAAASAVYALIPLECRSGAARMPLGCRRPAALDAPANPLPQTGGGRFVDKSLGVPV